MNAILAMITTLAMSCAGPDLAAAVGISRWSPSAAQYGLLSSDGRYGAVIVGRGGDIHYRVDELAGGTTILQTHPQYSSSSNDVKAAVFLDDPETGETKRFAAVYHYGHAGGYSWVGIWSLETGQLAETRTFSGWIRDIADRLK